MQSLFSFIQSLFSISNLLSINNLSLFSISTFLIFPFPSPGDKDGMQEAAELPQRGEVRGKAGQGVPHQDQDRPSPRGADQTGQFPPLLPMNNFIMAGERMQGCTRHRV